MYLVPLRVSSGMRLASWLFLSVLFARGTEHAAADDDAAAPTLAALYARLDGCVSFYCFPPVFVYRARRGARRRNIIFASSRGGGAM